MGVGRWSLGFGIALALIAAPSASATEVVFILGDGRFTSDRFVVRGDDDADDIEVVFIGGRIELTDRIGGIKSGVCDRVDAKTVSCPDIADLRVAGNGGDDEIEAAGLRPGYSRLIAIGGSGDDTISGGPQDDFLDGGDGSDTLVGNGGDDSIEGSMGNDRLRGRAGDDYLGGSDDPGADEFYGGSGEDLLSAGEDGEADRTVNCGGGSRDAAFVDRRDPRPKSCERVERERERR